MVAASGTTAPSGTIATSGTVVASAGAISGGMIGSGTSSGTSVQDPCFGDFTMNCGPGLTCLDTPKIQPTGECACTCGPCPAGTSPCPGEYLGLADTCQNLQTDPNNCGACGRQCPLSALACVQGTCDEGTPPSCAPGGPGMNNCGAGGSGTESCCTSLEVGGGTFFRTYDYDGDNPNGGAIAAADGGPVDEADPATVSSLRLDKYLVTVGRYRQFVAAWNAGWTPPAGSGKHVQLNDGQGLVDIGFGGGYETGWVTTDNTNIAPTTANLACGLPTWTNTAGSQENLPINCVNWYESYAFCIWDGGFLPSEAEWEYAAAGGSQPREPPWGSTPPGTSNHYAIYDCNYPNGSGVCSGLTNIAPVGMAAGKGVWGQLDMAGEVWEWNLDWDAAYVDPCTNCAYLSVTSTRMIRSGGFDDRASTLLPPPQNSRSARNRAPDVGLRCARSP